MSSVQSGIASFLHGDIKSFLRLLKKAKNRNFSFYKGFDLSSERLQAIFRNRDYVIEILALCPYFIADVSEELRDDPDVVKAAFTAEWPDALHYASERLLKHKYFVMELIEVCAVAFKYASAYLRGDQDVFVHALCEHIIQCMEEKRRSTLKVIRYTSKFLLLEHASESLKDNSMIVLAAVSANWKELEFATENLRSNSDIVLAAINVSGNALQFSSTDLQNDQDVVYTAFCRDTTSFQYASEHLKSDTNFVLRLLSYSPYCMQYVSQSVQDNLEIKRFQSSHVY